MKKLLLMAYALLAGTLTGLAQDLDSLYAQSMLKNGMVAPDFVIDSATNARLEDLRGRFVVLHFWASWCPDCRRDTPELKARITQLQKMVAGLAATLEVSSATPKHS